MDLSADAWGTGNHEAGSGRPFAKEDTRCARTTTPHAYYCGVDLHARSLFVHVLDDKGHTRLERDIAASPATFLDAVKPYRDGLVVGCECMFAWYWLADLCERERIPFVLGHALAMKAIHGGKAKNDRLDAAKIAGLLKGGFFPMAYVYPKDQRETRDLSPPAVVLRPPPGAVDRPHPEHQLPVQPAAVSQEARPTRATGPPTSPNASTHPSTQLSITADLALIESYDTQIAALEKPSGEVGEGG